MHYDNTNTTEKAMWTKEAMCMMPVFFLGRSAWSYLWVTRALSRLLDTSDGISTMLEQWSLNSTKKVYGVGESMALGCFVACDI